MPGDFCFRQGTAFDMPSLIAGDVGAARGAPWMAPPGQNPLTVIGYVLAHQTPASSSRNALALSCDLSSMQLLNTAWAYFTDRATGANRWARACSSSEL